MTQNKSNFSFLSQHWGFLLQDAQQVESYALRDPRAAAIYARRTLEISLKWLFANDTALKAPYEKSLAAMIHEPTFARNIKKGLFHDIKFIHRLGNIAVHGDENISEQEGLKATVALHQFLGWLARVYTRGGAKPDQFQITWLPKAEPDTPHLSAAQLEKIQADLTAKDEAAATAKAKLSQTESELAALKEQLALLQEVKETNKKTIGSGEYTEAQTRELIIDVMLREAGWNPKAKNCEEYEVLDCMPTATGECTGTGYVDYVLWGDNNKPLALVEAKRTRSDAQIGKRQAELYADCLEKHHDQRPIIYYSNGYTTWMWDDQFYPPREVQGFATRDELQWKINQRSSREDLSLMQPKKEITGRYYQMEAAARVMESFGTDRKRKSLVVMATGTGKTRLSIAMVDMLLRANWARKILFLADRVALVNQAKREFNRHLPHISVASLLDKTQEDARVLFSTYPTMLNCIDGTKKDQKEIFSVGHFDLIIIDEAHRSVYQKYDAIFDYFDSLLLGLTATPRGEVDRNTYKLFELEDHQPTYSYELDQAVKDGFLVPPRVISVPLKFHREGIKYKDLSADEQEEYELQEEFYDKESGELKEEIGSVALNQWLFNKDTVNKVLIHLMENGVKVEGGDKLGKTIIFAKNKNHAKFIVKQFDENYPAMAGKFCRRVDYSVKYVQSLIDDFSVKNKDPYIVASVDMLDTGIDVPEVVNLVFFKLVHSKTKFWQMIGRGTRLCEDLFEPGKDKQEFVVFDYCQNLEFFDANPEGYDSGVQESVKQKIFKRRLELSVALQNAKPEHEELENFGKKLKDQMHDVVTIMNLDNFIVRKQRKDVETFAKRERWNSLNDDDLATLEKKLSGLPSTDDDDKYARRFDLLILNLQTAILQNNKTQENYRIKVQEIAKGLEDKSAIPGVVAQMELIMELQTEQWWLDVSLPMLEDVRIRLRDLTRFIDKDGGLIDVFTNFEDEIGEESGEHNIVISDPKLKNYRKRVQRFINEHRDHVTIRRLKNNEPVSPTDIVALEDILFAEGGAIPRDEYERIFGEKPLGVLVRSLVGLSRKAAKEAFSEFLSEAPLHPDQIAFLDEVVEYLVKNGTMEPKVMFDTPFTLINDQGISGVFDENSSKKVIELVRHVNENAGIEKRLRN
ncbi:MAG: DEAD/DEAH box helicase family protein [Candidatus Thiodiazotropha sp. (ex Lucinoma kastoroae)]|nr:DEAD/DEAH box helicase family protein [Candidatus Thiodiazotropha sp. (ex Lucinoma kastoroae)]